MNIDKFSEYANSLHQRLADLYQTASASPMISEILPETFKELGSASEIVYLGTEELHQQNEEILTTTNLVEMERQRYQNLFEFAPDAYLVTDAYGIIQEANLAAAKLLNASQLFLGGQAIINFIVLDDRHRFRCELTHLSQLDRTRELKLRLQQSNGKCFDAVLTVVPVRNLEENVPLFLWLLRDIPGLDQELIVPLKNDCDLIKDRPLHKHSKGEIIPNNWQAIWYVCQGFVKLTTLCETGEEVLVGLVGEGMIFSSDLTSLQTYQATALSDVELVLIYLAEMVNSPMLNQALLPKLNQRLRQTESLLVLSGRRRVEDRLQDLLRVLKREMGETIPEGIRLSVRLTHEDLASACCTTRVTITRLIGKLQQQGKICFDAKKHIILKDIDMF